MKRNFHLKLLQSIIFIAICAVLFTIVQNFDFVSVENFHYENLIPMYLGWWIGEAIVYIYDKKYYNDKNN